MELDRIPVIAKYLSIVYLLAFLGSSMVWNFLPIYLERHISNVFLLGIVTSLPAAVPLLMDIPVGNLVQRVGERVVIFTGLLVGAAPALFYLTAVPALLVVGKALEGVRKSLVWNAGWSLAMKAPSEDIESESLSVFLLGVNVSTIIGPMAGGYIIASRGFNIPFGFWIFTSLLSVAVFYSYIGIQKKKGMIDSVERLFHRRTYLDEWHHVRDNWEALRAPLSLIFLYSIIFSFYWLAVPLLLDNIGTEFALMGLIFGFAALPKAFQFIFGDLADKFGRLKMMLVLSIMLVPVLGVMSTFSNQLVIGALFFVARTLSSGMSPIIHGFFDERTPDDLESELTGFLELFKHSGQTIGPVMAGTAASIWSIQSSFLAAAGIALVVAAVTYLVISDRL